MLRLTIRPARSPQSLVYLSSLPLTRNALVQFSRYFAQVPAPAGAGALPLDAKRSLAEEADHWQDNTFDKLRIAPSGDPTGRTFYYAVAGTTNMLMLSGVRVAVMKFVHTMWASADVLALASIEVDLGKIQPGETVTVKWRGKPVFIKRRTEDEVSAARNDDNADLRDKQPDAERIQRPEWLVVLGVCTHLGCVPVSNQGEYGGWFCPCHGSHYDLSGRIRKGPAPLNLEVPPYKFISDTKIVLG